MMLCIMLAKHPFFSAPMPRQHSFSLGPITKWFLPKNVQDRLNSKASIFKSFCLGMHSVLLLPLAPFDLRCLFRFVTTLSSPYFLSFTASRFEQVASCDLSVTNYYAARLLYEYIPFFQGTCSWHMVYVMINVGGSCTVLLVE